MYFPKKQVFAYSTLFLFLGDITFSVAAPYQRVAAAEQQQQFILYSPVLGESLASIAERFAIPESTLTEIRDRFSAYGWSSTVVLVPYSAQGEARLYNNYMAYQLKSRESLAAVASKFNRSTRELSVLNGQVMPTSKLSSLKAGDVILVPGPVSTERADNATGRDGNDQGKRASAIADEAVGLAKVLGANNAKGVDVTGMLTQRAAGSATGEASRSIEKFLGANGTAKVGIQANVNSGQIGYSLDYLQPLYERDEDIVFAQVGARTFAERNLANLGLGYRNQVNENWLLGVNGFLDQDMSRNHTRGGLGGEVWSDQARFSANYYTPLTGWKKSNDHRLNSDADLRLLQERAAQGWDANVEAALPGIKQLALTGKYFEWSGDRVDVSGSRSKTEKNPKGYTLGAKYQPIPLLNLNAQHTKVTGGQGGFELGVGFTWDFNTSLGEMLDPKKSIALRPLALAKTDIVNRNYNIVLEYQEKDKYAPLSFAVSSISLMEGTTDPGLRVQGGRQGLVTYSSSDSAVLGVNSSTGALTALTIGTVTVTATEQDASGKIFGSANYSVTVLPNASLQKPVFTIQAAAGGPMANPIVGQPQTAVAVCSTNCGAGSFNIQWEVETAPGSGQYVEIPGATGQTFTPQSIHQKKRIRFTAE